jgi:hypothetical protein
MDTDRFVHDLFAYFAGKYPDAVEARIRKLVDSIPESAKETILDHLVENQKANYKISVAEIVESCRTLGVSYSETKFIPAESWMCDACGHQFKYTVVSSDDDKLDRGLFDACPMCGFQPIWTKQREVYKTMSFWSEASEEQYQRAVANCTGRWGPGKPDGLFWARAKAEEDRRKERRINVEAKLAQIDRAKQLNLEGGAA